MPQRWTTFFAAVVLVVATACVRTPQLSLPAKIAISAAIADGAMAKAEAGDAEAQYYLGLAYSFGSGMPQDDVEAVRWYRLAADQGGAAAHCGTRTIVLNVFAKSFEALSLPARFIVLS